MVHKLINRKSVTIMALSAFFGLTLYLGYTTIKSRSSVIAETASSAKTTPDTHIHSSNTEEPTLKVFKPTLPDIPNVPTSRQTDSKPLEHSETNATPVSLPPEVVSTVITNGMVPVFYRLKTAQPVVFLTIDDGLVKDSAAMAFMAQHHLVATLFLNDSKISDNYAFFRTLQSAGNPIENHTVSHYDLTKLSYAQQKKEICDNADKFATTFGKRPTLFRPPYGTFNNNTRRAAADCGMTALIHWHAKANNGSVQYQEGDKLLPGDIVLMHFRKEVIADLTAFTEAAQKARLQTVLLEDWIK